MLWTCSLTVPGLSPSLRAISLFANPSATRNMTCCSRCVKMLSNRARAKADLYDMEFPQISPVLSVRPICRWDQFPQPSQYYLWIYIYIFGYISLVPKSCRQAGRWKLAAPFDSQYRNTAIGISGGLSRNQRANPTLRVGNQSSSRCT